MKAGFFRSICKVLLVLSLPVYLLFISGCKKEPGVNALAFSRDTLTFDTVFVTMGSTTRSFKVYNTGGQPITIERIQLMHLVGNQFRMNVNGDAGDNFTNIEIPAKDSIYVFIEVTVNPTSAVTPFVIIDDVNFVVNGQMQTVHLQAFGQNAHFHYGELIDGAASWTNDLPHVVISNDSIPGVLVAENASLTIHNKCQIYFAGNSGIFVEGTLDANADSWSDSIVFQGARLEQYYDDKPGQWFGLVFLRRQGGNPVGNFRHCVVNESSYGIYAGAGTESGMEFYQNTPKPVVTIDNTIIKNSLYNAVYGFNADITANNSLMYAAGEYLMKFTLGGKYDITHCTMYNTGSRYISHEQQTLLLSNVVAINQVAYVSPLESSFHNCVIYGSLQNEIAFSNFDDLNLTQFANEFSYCAMKTRADTLAMFSTLNEGNIFNMDPKFDEPSAGNFMPSDSAGYFSPLIDAAPDIPGLVQDIFGRNPVDNPDVAGTKVRDIGAVEAGP